jgi:hypothetical protein
LHNEAKLFNNELFNQGLLLSVQSKLSQFSIGFISLFFIIGVSLSATIVSGDELGRVNLLHFIGLFVIWPFISCLLLITLRLLPSPQSFLAIKSLVKLPIWSNELKSQLMTLKRDQRFNAWLFMQSQQSVLAFSVGCLVSFVMVLLFSDVAFLWRSTLLKTNHILPILEFIALPWSMTDIAQPAQWLVEATKENRMNSVASGRNHGVWWQFLLIAQIVYAIIPRLLSTLLARIKFQRLPNFSDSTISKDQSINPAPPSPQLAPVLNTRPVLVNYNLCCWLELDETMLATIMRGFDCAPCNTFQVGFHGADESTAIVDDKTQLLLVAAWEPPMGELKDYLEQGRGIVMLIDHKDGVWQPISNHYVDEWRRFCLSLTRWSLFIDKDLA